MKTTKYIYGLGLSFVLSGMFLNSCTDANDWGTDESFDRLFGTKQSSFTVTEGAISAEVEWDATVDTEYYIIEASTDSLYDEIPMGAENSIVYGEDGSITQSPYTITGLLGETTYYLRIKSMSKDKQSNWVYLPDYKFTTDKEQIISDVSDTDITDESVVLSWEAGLEVTHITYTQNGELVTYTLTDEEKASGKVTFSGLSAMTEYVFYIYNGEILRGEQTVTTKEAVMVESQISDIQQTSAVFTWDTSVGRLTGYYFAEGETYPQEANKSLTDEQITAGKIELTGLEPNTTYTVAIMRDNTVRAMQTFKTEMGIPSTYTKVEVADVSSWNTAMQNYTGKVAIVMTGDIDISNGTSKIPSGITSLLVYGGDDKNNKQYTFKTKGISFVANFDNFEIYNVNLISNGNEGNYIFDFSGVVGVNIQSLSITSCDVSANRGVVRIRSNSSVNIENVSFDDCRFSEMGNYGIITIEGGTDNKIDKVSLTNSTVTVYNDLDTSDIDKSGKYLMLNKGNHNINVTMDCCTLYGFNSPIFDNTTSNFELSISSTLFANLGDGSRLFRTLGSCTINKCENVVVVSGKNFEAGVQTTYLNTTDTEFFENPGANIVDPVEAVSFKVKNDDYKNFGDPYWNK